MCDGDKDEADPNSKKITLINWVLRAIVVAILLLLCIVLILSYIVLFLLCVVLVWFDVVVMFVNESSYCQIFLNVCSVF